MGRAMRARVSCVSIVRACDLWAVLLRGAGCASCLWRGGRALCQRTTGRLSASVWVLPSRGLGACGVGGVRMCTTALLSILAAVGVVTGGACGACGMMGSSAVCRWPCSSVRRPFCPFVGRTGLGRQVLWPAVRGRAHIGAAISSCRALPGHGVACDC